MTTTFDLNTLPIAKLVELYNVLAAKPVRTFKGKPTAVARLQKQLDADGLVIVEDESGPRTVLAGSVTAAEAKVNPGLARLRKNEKAEAIRAATNADGDAARAKVRADMPSEAPAQPKTREVGRDALGPKPAIDEVSVRRDDRKIKSVVANPKRIGTTSHARFAMYEVGQTVDQYVAACKEAGYKTRDARADVKWDSEHGYISLSK